MPIPPFNHHGLLPPFQGNDPVLCGQQSPYRASALEFVARFTTSLDRARILRGWLRFRRSLENEGIRVATQWLDGSFVEDKENDPERGTSPGDIDVVTLVSEWPSAPAPSLLNPRELKRSFSVDGYFLDLTVSPLEIVDWTRYWLQLFSHSRQDALWKGIVEVRYNRSEDLMAARLLGRMVARLAQHVD